MAKILDVLWNGTGVKRWSGEENNLAIFVSLELTSNFGGNGRVGLIGKSINFNGTRRIVLVCATSVGGLDRRYRANRGRGTATLIEVIGVKRARMLEARC
jgi:hypothetical protein